MKITLSISLDETEEKTKHALEMMPLKIIDWWDPLIIVLVHVLGVSFKLYTVAPYARDAGSALLFSGIVAKTITF